MRRRRSKLQKDIIHLLQNNRIRTQKEISQLLNKNPSSVSRSIRLLMKENLLAKNEYGYFLSSKLRKEMKALNRFYYFGSGLERMRNELSMPISTSLLNRLDFASNALKSSTLGIAEHIQSSQDSFYKKLSNFSSLNGYFKKNKAILGITKITQDSCLKISDTIKTEFEPVLKNVVKFNSSISENMKMQLQGSQLISLKLASLNSLNFSARVKDSLNSLTSSVEGTTKYLQSYSFGKVQAARVEFPKIENNLFKFETSSVIYKDLSLSIPYPIDRNVPEISEYESDHNIEAVKSRELKKLLFKINPDLDRKREGAWECIFSSNKDKCSQSANSMINFLEWTLRELAPEETVRNYFNMKKEDKITREKRLKYTLRSNQDSNIINFYIKNFLDIHKFLNKAKHSLEFNEENLLESNFYMIEGIILFLIKAKT